MWQENKNPGEEQALGRVVPRVHKPYQGAWAQVLTPLPIQLPANMHSGKQQVMAQALATLIGDTLGGLGP